MCPAFDRPRGMLGVSKGRAACESTLPRAQDGLRALVASPPPARVAQAASGHGGHDRRPPGVTSDYFASRGRMRRARERRTLTIMRLHPHPPVVLLTALALALAVAAAPGCSSTPPSDTTSPDAAAPAPVPGASDDGGACSGECSPITCQARRADCNRDAKDGCEVDLASDPESCGGCGKACAASEVCSATGCTTSCPAGQATCGRSCIDTSTNLDHCGACDKPCTAGANATATCAAGTCATACKLGFNACGGACVDSTPAHCGASCTVCPTIPHATATCSAQGSCGQQCSAGYNLCGGACVEDSAIACGAACSVCANTANGAGLCSAGACTAACDPGYRVCAGGCCAIAGPLSATSFDAGSLVTCAIESGGLLCWGRGLEGQLGTGLLTSATTPVQVAGLSAGVTQVAAAGNGTHVCALLATGAVRCWGSNGDGQLGNGTYQPSPLPVNVTGITNAVALATNSRNSCAVLATGGVKCWGDIVRSSTPLAIAGLVNVTTLTVGQVHGCAFASGGVKCWGANGNGQLGTGLGGGASAVPVAVSGLSAGVVEISGGTLHTCALLTGGTVKCWGENSDGQIGDGTWSTARVPTFVSGLSSVTEISAGDMNVCARISDGTVKCWGNNTVGQTGNGIVTLRETRPVDVVGLSGITSVSVGRSHVCARVSDGTLRCWGLNGFGATGNGVAGTIEMSPVEVTYF